MKGRREWTAGITALCAAATIATGAGTIDWKQDTQLRAMADEMGRSKTLQSNNLDKPYFIQYTSEDTDELDINASLGGVLHQSRNRVRRPGATIRVGDRRFDNTNSAFSRPARLGLFPLDNDYVAMRTLLWRATDALYKSATDQITRKRNVLREVSSPDKTADLAPAQPFQLLEPLRKVDWDEDAWTQEAKAASAEFAHSPDLTISAVRVEGLSSVYRLVNSEGTVLRMPETLGELQIRASGRTVDGKRTWDHRMTAAADLRQLPRGEHLRRMAASVAKETEALTKAPGADDYSGPVLFEGEAAAAMVAQTLTDAIVLHRKPVTPPGASQNGLQVINSVWSARLNAAVAPEWMSIYDDPMQTEFHGTSLAGHYMADDEGVPAQRVSLVEKGKLKGFLLSRTPVRTFEASNGHGRLPGQFGSEEAVIGNLFVTSQQAVPMAQLKTQLLEKVKTAGLSFGLIVRRLDFPSTAPLAELQSMARQLQNSGFARTLNQPLLTYRVYGDGREELVRGLRFGEFSAKDLRDVVAAADDPYVLNYVNNGSSFNIADLRGAVTLSTVVCPSLLFDSVELVKADNEGDAAPIVPAPALETP